MKFFIIIATALTLFLCDSVAAYAQMNDEIVVTATRRSNTKLPSVYYTRRGDFLLLQVEIESDDRSASERLKELTNTIESFVEAAKADGEISLSFIDEGNFVRALTPALYEDAISYGNRPDTSIARVQIKTAIPDDINDAFALSRKLLAFVEGIDETGRVTISTEDAVTISVVNPAQYRKDVVRVIIDDVNNVTAALGPEYRVILEGLDKPMSSFRSGDLSLSFYLPYQYIVIPDTLHSYRVFLPEDY